MNKHTKEPWSYQINGAYVTVRVNDVPIAELWRSDGKHEANARRIVACVNYCAGKSTEELEAAQPEGERG